MRRHARGPEILEHVEFAARPVVAEEVGEPAELVFLLHAARPQRGLVERRKADRVDLAAALEVEGQRQRGQHERAVRGGGDPARERRRAGAIPVERGNGSIGQRSRARRRAASRASRPLRPRRRQGSRRGRSRECAPSGSASCAASTFATSSCPMPAGSPAKSAIVGTVPVIAPASPPIRGSACRNARSRRD